MIYTIFLIAPGAGTAFHHASLVAALRLAIPHNDIVGQPLPGGVSEP